MANFNTRLEVPGLTLLDGHTRILYWGCLADAARCAQYTTKLGVPGLMLLGGHITILYWGCLV